MKNGLQKMFTGGKAVNHMKSQQ